MKYVTVDKCSNINVFISLDDMIRYLLYKTTLIGSMRININVT